MSLRRNPDAFWEVAFGGVIALGATLIAASITFGVEAIKAETEAQTVGFYNFLITYLITGLILIGVAIAAARQHFITSRPA